MASFTGYSATYSPISYPQMGSQQYQDQMQQIRQMQQMQQIQAQPQATAQTMSNSIVWIKQRREAEDYLLAPNNSVVFMDEAMTHIYMKSADQFGRPTFSSKLLVDDTDGNENAVDSKAVVVDEDKYMTRKEFENWLESFEKKMSEAKTRQTSRKSVSKGGTENE